ncbi:L-threonylcarbamoyladenylate synthase [Candidatus Falkowbacteria bacterium]|nr:L-threonylcarbamoyladenylate synthase [Candidatus Falkowbacteria bacterium]
MEKLKIDLKKISKEEINAIVDFFNRGKVVVYPTDTIYGLGCRADDAEVISKIIKIKKREKRKPLLVLVDSIKMVKKYCYVSKWQEKVLRGVWLNKIPLAPFMQRGVRGRRVTVVLKSRKNSPYPPFTKGALSKKLTGGGDGLAVRLPKNDFLIKIIKKVGVPIVSTSVNVSGEKSLTSVKNIEKKIPPTPLYTKGAKMDLSNLVVDAGTLKGRPSMVVDLRDVNNIKILRK